MIEMLILVLSKQIYLLGLISAFIIGGILRHEGYFAAAYQWISNRLNNKKAVLGIMSIIGGVLPVEGRCSVSAPILDSMVNRDSEGRKKMGVVDYIATHHYYLWSPIEPSVLIFLSALGISWLTFMQATIIPLVIYLLAFAGLLIFYVKEEDVQFKVAENKEKNSSKSFTPFVALFASVGLMIFDPVTFAFWYTFPFVALATWLSSSVSWKDALSYINWPTVVVVSAIIALGAILKTYNGEILAVLADSGVTLLSVMVIGFLGAFIMGSSSKYAGLGAAMLSIIGAVYLPLVVIVEFIGYLLSPVHKCLGITKMYFNTKISEYYKVLIPLVIWLLVGAGVAQVLMLMG